MGKLMAAKPNLKELRMNKGWTQEQVAEKARISGMNDHVGKPLDFDEVLNKLRTYLC